MNIIKEQQGTALTIRLDDRLDTLTAPLLEEELKKGLDGVESLNFDFSNLEYITSAGLRALVIAQRMMYGHGTMKVTNASELVRGVFNMVGLNNMLSEE